MEIIGKFKNGSITISNLKTEEVDKFHFSFDVSIKTYNFSLTYNFGEVACFNMYNVIDGKQTKLQDENFMGNFLEFTKDFFSISINENGVASNIKLNFNQFEDQEILFDFLNELNAWCETLIRRR